MKGPQAGPKSSPQGPPQQGYQLGPQGPGSLAEGLAPPSPPGDVLPSLLEQTLPT